MDPFRPAFIIRSCLRSSFKINLYELTIYFHFHITDVFLISVKTKRVAERVFQSVIEFIEKVKRKIMNETIPNRFLSEHRIHFLMDDWEEVDER